MPCHAVCAESSPCSFSPATILLQLHMHLFQQQPRLHSPCDDRAAEAWVAQVVVLVACTWWMPSHILLWRQLGWRRRRLNLVVVACGAQWQDDAAGCAATGTPCSLHAPVQARLFWCWNMLIASTASASRALLWARSHVKACPAYCSVYRSLVNTGLRVVFCSSACTGLCSLASSGYVLHSV